MLSYYDCCCKVQRRKWTVDVNIPRRGHACVCARARPLTLCPSHSPPLSLSLYVSGAAAGEKEPERRDGSAEVGQPERNETWSGMADKSPTLLLKLFAAGFYGLSSFLIVVVNKSVLTNYR